MRILLLFVPAVKLAPQPDLGGLEKPSVGTEGTEDDGKGGAARREENQRVVGMTRFIWMVIVVRMTVVVWMDASRDMALIIL